MSKKKTVFISGPITGRDESQSRQAFAEAWALLDADGFEPVDPWDVHDAFPWADRDQILAIDLAILKQCDAIYLLNGWQDSEGAQEELLTARCYDLGVLYEEFYAEEV